METIEIIIPEIELEYLNIYNKTRRFDAVLEGNIIGTYRIIKSLNEFNILEFINLNNIKYYVYNYYGLVNSFNSPVGFSFTLINNILTIQIPEGII
jgi:hypothetical protein